jgi:hypothetical protein
LLLYLAFTLFFTLRVSVIHDLGIELQKLYQAKIGHYKYCATKACENLFMFSMANHKWASVQRQPIILPAAGYSF